MIFYIYFLLDKIKQTPPLHGLPLILLLTFTLLWLFFGEFRTKMIRIVLHDDHVLIQRFGGLSTGKTYRYKELNGFKISVLPSQGGNNEYLYFINNNKKVGKISDCYHKNYPDLKKETMSKLKDLGAEQFALGEEIKETFS